MANGRRIGLLTLQRNGHRFWEPGDQPLIEELADGASMLRILALVNTDATPRDV